MNYCTQADLINAFGADELIQLTDRANPPTGQIDTGRVDDAIATAMAEINVYLEGRYPLPLPTMPLVLRRVAIDLARYHLYTDIHDDHPAAIRYGNQVKLLTRIADGRVSLGLDDGGAVQKPADTIQVSEGRTDWSKPW